ncbi:hypothetical protein V1514DRAFT_339465 [Lipomyces japonicus]|uniref:uncharacterized protein n=1 Tax=Lipomyces japonicus TaxID=56871 RepID=UPI0034CD94E4
MGIMPIKHYLTLVTAMQTIKQIRTTSTHNPVRRIARVYHNGFTISTGKALLYKLTQTTPDYNQQPPTINAPWQPQEDTNLPPIDQSEVLRAQSCLEALKLWQTDYDIDTRGLWYRSLNWGSKDHGRSLAGSSNFALDMENLEHILNDSISQIICECGIFDDTAHALIHCELKTAHRSLLGPDLTPANLLGTRGGVARVKKFLEEA